MEDENGNLTFTCRYNTLQDGKQGDGKVEFVLPKGILDAVKQFIQEKVIPVINTDEKI